MFDDSFRQAMPPTTQGLIKLRSVPIRLRNHYTIEMLNELDQVDALGAACPRCNTSENPVDFLSPLCLVLPYH